MGKWCIMMLSIGPDILMISKLVYLTFTFQPYIVLSIM